MRVQRKTQSLPAGLAKIQWKKWNQFTHWIREKKKCTYSTRKEKYILIEKICVCLGEVWGREKVAKELGRLVSTEK